MDDTEIQESLSLIKKLAYRLNFPPVPTTKMKLAIHKEFEEWLVAKVPNEFGDGVKRVDTIYQIPFHVDPEITVPFRLEITR